MLKYFKEMISFNLLCLGMTSLMNFKYNCYCLSLQSLVYFTFASLGGDPLAQMSLVGVSQCTFCVDLIHVLFLPYVVVLCFLNYFLQKI